MKYMRQEKEMEALLLCHALEKGMGMAKVKPGYGEKKAKRLMVLLPQLLTEQGETYLEKECISVLEAYLRHRREMGSGLKEMEQAYQKLVNHRSSRLPAGCMEIPRAELLKGMEVDFQTLIKTRHSVRKFADDRIQLEEMERAIQMAIQSPSACNRQPWKVYYSLDREKNRRVAELIPGNQGFREDIPYYAVITVDRRLFGGNEIFQWYVNGGIFAAYLMLALHTEGIGSCSFQWPDFYSTEKALKRLAGIPKSEVVIMALGYGKYPEQARCIAASRKGSQDVLVNF